MGQYKSKLVKTIHDGDYREELRTGSSGAISVVTYPRNIVNQAGGRETLLRNLGLSQSITHARRPLEFHREGHSVSVSYHPADSACRYQFRDDGERLKFVGVLCGDILTGLDEATRFGLHHGDLKPESLVLRGSTIVATGLGGCFYQKPKRTSGPYTAPEVAAGGSSSTASDIYALGKIVSEILVGDRNTPVDQALAKVKVYSPGWSRVLKSMLRKDPDARPGVEALQEAVFRLLPDGGQDRSFVSSGTMMISRKHTAQRARRIPLLAVFAVLALSGGGAYAYVKNKSNKTTPQKGVAKVISSVSQLPAVTPIEASRSCPLEMTDAKTYCIDKFEYPGQGQQPMVGVSHQQAAEACAAVNKKLCSGRQWEQACRGSGGASWPYGSKYDKDVCNVRSSKIRPTGEMSRCESRVGAWDMSGNVAEWTSDGRVRGGSATDGANGRCSVRGKVQRKKRFSDVGFRCCSPRNQR